MIAWLLRSLNATPGRVFYETELRQRDEAAFDELRSESLLRRLPDLAAGDSYDWDTRGRLLTIVDAAGKRGLEAIDTDDPDAAPIGLTDENLRQWEVDEGRLIDKFRAANELTGPGEALEKGLYLLGERESEDAKTACCLSLAGSSDLVAALAPLPGLLGHRYSSIVVGCFAAPTHAQRTRLGAIEIMVSVLDENQPLFIRELRLPGGLFYDHDLIRNDDYTAVRWRDATFTFTPVEAIVIRRLHDGYKAGQPAIAGSRLMLDVQSSGLSTASNVRDVMKRSPAWMALVVASGRRGYYKLDLP